jgi:hypothetical protein
VPAPPDQIGVAVAIDVVDQDGHTGVGVQRELGMPDPLAVPSVRGRFGPAAAAHHVASTIPVDVTESDSMPDQRVGQIVPDPSRRHAAVTARLVDHFIPGSEFHPVGQHVQPAVSIDVVQRPVSLGPGVSIKWLGQGVSKPRFSTQYSDRLR